MSYQGANRSSGQRLALTHTGTRGGPREGSGRPRTVVVDVARARLLQSQGVEIKRICAMLGVSPRTLFRRLAE